VPKVKLDRDRAEWLSVLVLEKQKQNCWNGMSSAALQCRFIITELLIAATSTRPVTSAAAGDLSEDLFLGSRKSNFHDEERVDCALELSRSPRRRMRTQDSGLI